MGEYVRVTVTLPAPLLQRVREETDNVSGFVAAAIEERFAAEDWLRAPRRSHGALAARLGHPADPEAVLASLERLRSGWARADR